jgi:mannitol 2-dehydrogenase
VQVVDDVEPFELMKLRLLNAGHQALAHAGRLLGHEYAHEATLDADVQRFVRAYMAEARPSLPRVPGVDLDEYIEELIRRFANPQILDTLARLATDASDRVPKFVLPAVRDNLVAGRPVDAAAALVACWARCEEGRDDLGGAIGHNDPLHEELAALAASERDVEFLGFDVVFGDLAASEAFVEAYRAARRALREQGARGLLAQFV